MGVRLKWAHPSILYPATLLILLGSGEPEVYPRPQSQCAKLHTHLHTHLHTIENLEMAISLRHV